MIAHGSHVVVPGYYGQGVKFNSQAAAFGVSYLEKVKELMNAGASRDDFLEGIQRRFPTLPPSLALDISASVLTGELEWYQGGE